MKNGKVILRGCAVLIALLAGAQLSLRAQDAKLQIDFLNKLEARASETVDVTVEGPLLQVAKKFLQSGDADSDEKKVAEMIDGLKGIYVKSYEFEKSGEFSEADIEQIRQQLRAPSWTKMVNVRSKKEGESVDVYTLMQGENIGGMAIIVAESKELTVVNIVGSIDMAKLAELSGRMGVPALNIDFGNQKSSKEQ